jgi:Mrp family chromosome partitioning ATPase
MLELSETTLVDQLEMLRVQLETSLPLPIVLLVSAARGDDGHGFVASGLARSMHSAGYSTLLVRVDDANEREKAVEPSFLDDVVEFGIESRLLRGPRASLPTLSLQNTRMRRTVSKTGVARFADICRKSYQVTVVDAPDVLTNSLSLLTAVASDGVILTVREGRRVHKQDREVAKILSRERAPLLGIVSVASSIIEDQPALELHRRPIPVGKIRTTMGNLEAKPEEQAV